MKVKDIINEGPGFISGFAKGLLPQGLKAAISQPIRGDDKITNQQADDLAANMFDPKGEHGWADENELERAAAAADEMERRNKKREQQKKALQQAAQHSQSNIITPDDPEFTSDESYSLADENLAPSERIRVETPAGTMYKYPDGRWYQIPSTGIPTPVNQAQYSALNDYANRDGSIEKIPPRPKTRKR